jgi:hypothetical protein
MPATKITMTPEEVFASLYQVIIDLKYVDKVPDYDLVRRLKSIKQNRYGKLKNNHVIHAIHQTLPEELNDIIKKSIDLYSYYN